MNAQSPVPSDGPMMRAWTAYQATEEYANTRKWAGHVAHVDGSLWAAFDAGYRAAGGNPFAGASKEPAAVQEE